MYTKTNKSNPTLNNSELMKLSEIRNNIRKKLQTEQKEKMYLENLELQKIKTQKYKKIFEKNKKLNIFNESDFTDKHRKDFYIFDALCEKALDDNKKGSEIISNEIGNLYKITKFLYEEFNMKPLTLFKEDISKSENKLIDEGKRIINNFLNLHYYSSSKKNRVDAYHDKIFESVLDSVEKGELTEDKIEIEIHKINKELLMNSFLEQVTFPRNKMKNITLELEKMKKNEYFNTDHLNSVLESYEFTKNKLSKMLALLL